MKATRVKGVVLFAGVAALALAGCSNADGQSGKAGGNNSKSYTTREVTDELTTFTVIENPNGGATLSYSADGGIGIVEVEEDGYTYAFKDLNGDGKLDPAEDWRKDARARAEALAPELAVEQIAGLMLFSSHERAPGDGLTDDQKTYLSESHLRNVLNAGGSDVEENVQWSNEMQAYVETLASTDTPYIPVNFSSDPRSDAAESLKLLSAGEGISQWPSSLGLAATFDVDTVKQFGEMASEEYKALGIGTALSPQIDLATEPRWPRVSGTFGEGVELASEMAKAYVEGFQGTYNDNGEDEGWGDQSVNTVIKHFPGDGLGEGGREAHQEGGKYAVAPGNNLDEQLQPFLSSLDSAAVMTSYSIITNAEGEEAFGKLMGSAYDKERVDILRKDSNYDGVIVTDWGVTAGGNTDPDAMIGTAWGADDISVDERHFLVLQTGIDMFGGNNEVEPVMAAYDMWQAAYEKGDLDISADERFQQSGVRILEMLFQIEAYDNPYLELETSTEIVGSEDKVQAGNDAQLNSVVMLKNSDNTISSTSAGDWSDKTVYVPQSYNTGHAGMFGAATYEEGPGIDLDLLGEYFKEVVTDQVEKNADGEVTKYTAPDLSNVDVVLVGMDSPDNGGTFTSAGFDQEKNEYYPLSLQYREYKADGENVRKVSIAGNTLDDGSKENRSYYGKTSRISNESVLDSLERAVKAVEDSGKEIPIISVITASNPVIPAEFEAQADAIVVGFGVSQQALVDNALGIHEPAGRLPMAFPINMDTVEANQEDVADDLTEYVDADGNTYSYGFGLNFSGVIKDK